MWAIRECAAGEDTELNLKNTGEKAIQACQFFHQNRMLELVCCERQETYNDSQVKGEALVWKRNKTSLENRVRRKKCVSIIQSEFLLESRLQRSVAWGGFI